MSFTNLVSKYAGSLSTNELDAESIESIAKKLKTGVEGALKNLKPNDNGVRPCEAEGWYKKNKNSWFKPNGDGYKVTLRFKNKVVPLDPTDPKKNAINFDTIGDVETFLNAVKDALKTSPYEEVKDVLEGIKKMNRGVSARKKKGLK